MGPVFANPPAVMGRCCASRIDACGLAVSWPLMGAPGLASETWDAELEEETPEAATCASTNAEVPTAIRPRKVVVRRAVNMAASIWAGIGPSIDRKVEARPANALGQAA